MRLIQRLGKGLGYINPFGEAKATEGLSDDVLDAISRTFQIQYMGAAEYEWGAFAKAMAKLHEYKLQIVPMKIAGLRELEGDIGGIVCNTSLGACAVARDHIKSIYMRSMWDFNLNGDLLSQRGGKRTEVSRDDWGSFYDAVNDVDKYDSYHREDTIGWLDLGYDKDDTYAWFLHREDAEKFVKLVKRPVPTQKGE